jgi:hypothetical protein
MGYLKYKRAGSTYKYGTIPTENIAQITSDGGSGEVIIIYDNAIKLSIYDANVSMVQADVDAVINGVNILNGTSGSSMDIVLSQPITDVEITKES